MKPPPPLHPMTHKPLNPEDLSPLFPDELIKQEVTNERFISIPDEVIDVFRLWRPTPLIRSVFFFSSPYIIIVSKFPIKKVIFAYILPNLFSYMYL